MSRLSPDSWKAVSPYLDQALTMDDQGRSAFLASLREQLPDLAGDLAALLEDYRRLGGEGFLDETPVASASQAVAGSTVGAYKLLKPIGEGGMGAVWLAERSDGRFQRQAALKFLKLELAGRGGSERFEREGNILGRLAHPHIAQLLDAGVSSAGHPY